MIQPQVVHGFVGLVGITRDLLSLRHLIRVARFGVPMPSRGVIGFAATQ